jgi:hypothetical protein
MPNLIMTKLKDQDHEPTVRAKIMAFLGKLTEDDTLPGLHIEPMAGPLDPRVRTGRVDIHLRAVLYRLDPLGGERTYVYAGTWKHDEAIERARSRKLQINPVSGIVELIGRAQDTSGPVSVSAPGSPKASVSFLTESSYFVKDLTDEFGFPDAVAREAFEASNEGDLLDFAESLENEWQSSVLLGMSMRQAISQIKDGLAIDPDESRRPSDSDLPQTVSPFDDLRLVEAFKHPAAQMQFAFIEGEEELQRVIDGGDFGAWRVFLHPEQRRYVKGKYNGPFRLSGGAGTGKTVVLLHRARNLSVGKPDTRVILTTFTRALADNLRLDLVGLDPSVQISDELGDGGVLVRGVDQLAATVREMAGPEFASAAKQVLGGAVELNGQVVSNDANWDAAVDDSSADLPVVLRSKSFLSAEYLQVVLPNQVLTADDYLAVNRQGRGVALGRAKRSEVWKVIEQYRKNSRISNTLSFAEVAAVDAAWLIGVDGSNARPLADHILIDEAQDLTAAHWQFLRSIVGSGVDDMFIADDVHQRIYGQPVVLSRLRIGVIGRSRRLTLNYRTTEQNLRYALGFLEGASYVDSEGNEEGISGYRSARSGPLPVAIACKSDSDQAMKVGSVVKNWLESGIAGETIAILTASNNASKDVFDILEHHGVRSTLLNSAKQAGTHPVILTMFNSKGLEFSRVVLFDISDGSFPPQWSLKGVAPEDRADVLLRERSLLYVAASRARDELVVTWKGQPSALLNQPKQSAEAPSR